MTGMRAFSRDYLIQARYNLFLSLLAAIETDWRGKLMDFIRHRAYPEYEDRHWRH